ncbi:tyrosine-type recombinase/integrase [Vibrio sp. 1978]|uniref:tyrosine-type recombinase/integrase n=1 Tax=Vibrio sp. 1978 TaxID=3074585 RepID=UPI0029662039|nr:tyrosine-type recombinase/integrase [Vibrio sp. 1978]MDW3058688.1 tyrosine-type recombinase/integrase [Vibrio sp. 1978]
MAPRSDVNSLPSGIECHGHSLRIVFYYKGKRHRESLGLPPTKQNINFARSKRETILYEMKIGVFNYAQHFPNSKHATGKPKSITVGELAKRFIESKEVDVRSSTLQRYDWVMRDFCEMYGANRSCDTLSPRSLSTIRQKLVKNLGARTVNRNLVTINAFLAWLFKMEYVDKDYSKLLERVKEARADIEPFSIEEIDKALASLNQLQHKNMFILLIYTGLRSGELCALAWEDVDFENKTIHVRRSTYEKRGLKTTKTDEERYVDLMPPAIEALKAQRHLTYLYPAKTHDVELPGKTFRQETLRFVFNPKAVRKQKGSDYDYYGKRALGRIWEEACASAGIKYRNQYQTRHTYASWMITHANVNVSYLAQQMGHANITMVAKIYGKWLQESNKKESDRVWRELEKLQK